MKIVHTHSILATTHLSLLNERNMSAVESTQKAKTLLALKTVRMLRLRPRSVTAPMLMLVLVLVLVPRRSPPRRCGPDP